METDYLDDYSNSNGSIDGDGWGCEDNYYDCDMSDYNRQLHYGSGSDGRGHYAGDPDGYGDGEGDGNIQVTGHGCGIGPRDIHQYRNGNGSSDDTSGVEKDGEGTCVHDNILFELGMPEHLHPCFEPLTPNNMLMAQDFIHAESQEQRDAVLGILELQDRY